MSTSKKVLGRFHLKERIDADGYTTVYKAIEDMGQGLERPAAVKILQTWSLDDDEQLEQLRREVEVLVDAGGAPNVVSIFGLGVDNDMGAWIAMELAGKSLRHFIREEPVEPELVRSVLRDALLALDYVHSAEPPILHRDLKPQNILTTRQGVWKVADFGLAKRAGAEDTVALATVKYAAPELLDSSLGAEGPGVDLYALGMVAYELALGKQLFRQQFPSIYGAGGGENEADDRPKWMYWHTSAQMTLTPVAELVEGYPQDLSDLIAALTQKELGQRLRTARAALDNLGSGYVSTPLGVAVESVEEKERRDPIVRPWVAGLVAATFLAAMTLGLLWFFIENQPAVSLEIAENQGVLKNGAFATQTSQVDVHALVENWTSDMRAVVTREGDDSPIDAELLAESRPGLYRVTVGGLEYPRRVEAQFKVLKGKNLVLRQPFTILREQPEDIGIWVTARTRRSNGTPGDFLSGARLTGTIVGSEQGDVQLSGIVDGGGECVLLPLGEGSIAPGRLTIGIDAFGFDGNAKQSASIGYDAEVRFTALFPKVTESRLWEMIQAEISALGRVQSKCQAGEALSRRDRERWREAIANLTSIGSDAAVRETFLLLDPELDPCSPEAQAMVEVGSTVAESGARAAENALDGGSSDALAFEDPESLGFDELVEAHDQALGELHAMYLQKRAAEPTAWPSVLDGSLELLVSRYEGLADQTWPSQIQKAQEYVDLVHRQRPGDTQRYEVAIPPFLKGSADLEDRKQAWEERRAPGAPTLVSSPSGEGDSPLAALLGNVGDESVRDLLTTVLGEGALDGLDTEEILAALGRLEGLMGGFGGGRGLAAGFMSPGASQGEGEGDYGGTGSPESGARGRVASEMAPNPLLESFLASLPMDEFEEFVQLRIPAGTLAVEVDETVDQVRVRGLLFSELEYESMYRRLFYARQRIQFEVRIDPFGLARNLGRNANEILEEGVFVDAFRAEDERILYFQFPLEAESESEPLTALARSYVYDTDLLWIRAYADAEDAAAPEPAGVEADGEG